MIYPGKRYSIILADFPFEYNDPKGNDPALGGITYEKMEIEEMAKLPIYKIAKPDCAYFFWCFMPHIAEGNHTKIIKGNGFKPITTAFSWLKLNPNANKELQEIKNRINNSKEWINNNSSHRFNCQILEGKKRCDCGFNEVLELIQTLTLEDIFFKSNIYSGIGHWLAGNQEICFFAKRGQPKRINKSIKQVLIAPRGKHSSKPAETRDRIKQLFGEVDENGEQLNYIELFARPNDDGTPLPENWDYIGWDITKKDIREDLAYIINEESSDQFDLNKFENSKTWKVKYK